MESKMSIKSELDLAGVAWPFCLLEFKNAFDALCSCEVLEVLSHDPDVVKNILMIADRSEGKLIEQKQEGDLYRIFIQKE
jgi:TusA-related sulfurtransferase